MEKKDKRLIKIIISIIIVLILLLVLVVLRLTAIQNQENKDLEKIKSYTTIEDFKNVEEVARYLECDYKKQEKSKVENYDLDIYIKIKVLPYTENISNETFYNKLISYSAKVLNFKNFRIIDKENSITVEVICNKEDENIKSIIINGEQDYFSKKESELQIQNYKETKQTNLNIQSDILKKLIDNNWKLKESDIGTKESTFNSYDIYFDEGIEIRKIDNKIFNIIFTSKYKSNIVNNITTSTSKEEIIKLLGEPTFKDEFTNLIGYKSAEIYVFLNTQEKQISIYRVEKNYNSNMFTEAVESYLTINNNNEFLEKLKNNYKCYDKFNTTENLTELVYSDLGIKVQFGTNIRNGILIYKNYKGNITKDININQVLNKQAELPYGIYIENEDSVFLAEKERIEKLETMKFNAVSETALNENISNSNMFYTIKEYIDNDSYSIKFLSVDNSLVNSELKENINSYLWIDNYNFIYSIKNRGIYLYNTKSRIYKTLITGNEEFNIIGYEDNKLKYDEKVVKLK